MGLNITETMNMALRRLEIIFYKVRCLVEAKTTQERKYLEAQWNGPERELVAAIEDAIEAAMKIAEKNLDDLKWRITMLEDKLERFENGEEE
jgi:hypothetical protein